MLRNVGRTKVSSCPGILIFRSAPSLFHFELGDSEGMICGSLRKQPMTSALGAQVYVGYEALCMVGAKASLEAMVAQFVVGGM